jgi:arylsulfatase A-like enzyme
MLASRWLAVALAAVSMARGAARPNILFIMTDDHASHAISAYGSRVNQTPNMDRLAIEGMLFENCFVTNSICTPSRATLLTGKFSHLNGSPVFNRFDGSQDSVSKRLQSAGYFTAVIGKWHLGSDPTGFDVWEILPGQGAYDDPVLYTAAGKKTYTGRYATNVMTELTIKTIENRPKDKPFFILCHHKAPHRAWTPEEKYRQEFAAKSIPEPATLWDDYDTRTDALKENRQTTGSDLTNLDLKRPHPAGRNATPEQRQAWNQERPSSVAITRNGTTKELTGRELAAWKYQRYMQDYLACVQSVDDSIGTLLEFLRATDLEQNTLVIYTSDNGFFLGDHGLYDKRFMYEPSLRIPFLVRWPAVIKPGARSSAMVINNDFAPTFLDAAGEPVPESFQGRSIVPILRGATPPDWRTSMYYRYYHDPGDHNTPQHLGVRTMTHKLVHYWKKDQWEMFDLVADPNEMNNLYGQPLTERLTSDLKAELERLKIEARDDDQFAHNPPKTGPVDGSVEKLRGR